MLGRRRRSDRIQGLCTKQEAGKQKKVPNRPRRCQFRFSSFRMGTQAQGQTIEINGGKLKHERRHCYVVVGGGGRDVSNDRTSGQTRDSGKCVQSKRRRDDSSKKIPNQINEQRKSSVSKKYICINDGTSKKYQNLCRKRRYNWHFHILRFQHRVSMKGCLRPRCEIVILHTAVWHHACIRCIYRYKPSNSWSSFMCSKCNRCFSFS